MILVQSKTWSATDCLLMSTVNLRVHDLDLLQIPPDVPSIIASRQSSWTLSTRRVTFRSSILTPQRLAQFSGIMQPACHL